MCIIHVTASTNLQQQAILKGLINDMFIVVLTKTMKGLHKYKDEISENIFLQKYFS